MLLSELFDNKSASIKDQLRDVLVDRLTPLAGNKVPHVTIQSVLDLMKQARLGIAVNRSLLMTVLDPNEVLCIEKIEGDLVYLTNPAPDEIAKREEDEEMDKEKIRQKANKQAKKEVTASDDSVEDIAAKARADLMN
jgi:hypothetical protein